MGLRRCIDDSNTWVGVFPENDKQRGQAPPFRPVIVLRFDTTRERRQPNKDTDLDVGMRKNLTRTPLSVPVCVIVSRVILFVLSFAPASL